MKRLKFEKTLSKVPLPVKMAARKFDDVLRFSAACLLFSECCLRSSALAVR